MTVIANISAQKIWDLLETVTDPEVPVLSILDLGIVRDVKIDGERVEIVITPTYTGCPAMDMISMNIRMALMEQGYANVLITQVLAPAWTTDWMSQAGKDKLKGYGIAPPVGKSINTEYLETLEVECPLCRSTHTKLLSAFGSTACKALFQCADCKEPFDYFKCH
jgi:ring-1,2-phenylacetyl-CoA epoxidase subunit PaaD